ncbi:MAG: hypothetical protein A2Z29_02780 [Chloroflexi bacterium RBG_16_56_11]|nr:MAG: hypothetical protein A2Z29_02780 [Chloroflexi bacterium RBG_16_56_11]
MPNGGIDVPFFDTWAWLIFIGAGLAMVILELIIGIDTGLDLVFIGSAFVIGGLVPLPFHTWAWTAIISGIICVLYVIIGRRYVHRRMAINSARTNIDAIIGRGGIVQSDISPGRDGLVKVGNEEWRARAGETIKRGEEIKVTGVQGVTLTVVKAEAKEA